MKKKERKKLINKCQTVAGFKRQFRNNQVFALSIQLSSLFIYEYIVNHGSVLYCYFYIAFIINVKMMVARCIGHSHQGLIRL